MGSIAQIQRQVLPWLFGWVSFLLLGGPAGIAAGAEPLFAQHLRVKGIPLLIFGFEKGSLFGENDIFVQR